MSKYNWLFVFLFCFHVYAGPSIRINGGQDLEDTRHFYTRSLIHLILKVTEKEFGKVDVKEVYYADPEETRKDFLKGKLDISSLPTQMKELPSDVHFVPFPIRMGLLGYRILLIKSEKQKSFDSVSHLKDLQKFKMAFFPSWQDIHVYQENKLPLYMAKGYLDVFKAVIAGKADYTSRSIIEISKELKALKLKGIELEMDKHILLHYPFADFFYLKKSKKILYRRFVTGFKTIIKDGSWIKLLRKFYSKELAALELKKRQLIELKNPIFGPNHLENLYYWIDHDQLLKEVDRGLLGEKGDI